MKYIWIICICNEGVINPYRNLTFKTKKYEKIGNHIRNNLMDYVTMFRIIKDMKPQKSDASKLQKRLMETNIDNKTDAAAYKELLIVLQEFTDKEIIKEINRSIDKKKGNTISIIKIPANRTIKL